MKKFQTIKTAAAEIAKKDLENGFQIPESETATAFTENEILSLLMFQEIRKALTTKTTEVLLDCDYQKSRSADKEMSISYFRILSTDKTFDSKLQLKRDGADRLHFNLSVKYLDKLPEVEGLKYSVKRDKNQRPKNIRVQTTFDQLLDCYKTLTAVLAADPKSEEK